jgi:CubicO group peptidase (beta-lactamase class C family)
VDTPFRVGSVSKTFVSLAAMKLLEEGRLRLEDPVARLLPEVAMPNRWARTDPIRLIHLLEHTAGFDDFHLKDYAHNDPTPLSLERSLAVNESSRKVRYRPGTHFAYSNSGPPVAARVVEKLTGMPFENFVERNLFQPLEIRQASFLLTPRIERSLARGYRLDRLEPVPYSHILQRPSGALNISISELSHLVQMLSNSGKFGDRELISRETFERMLRPESTLAGGLGMPYGYAKGLFTVAAASKIFYGHDGGISGYRAGFWFQPQDRSGFAVAVNRPTIALERIIRLFFKYLTRTATPAPRMSLSLDELQSYTGAYRFSIPRSAITGFITRLLWANVELKGGKLYLETFDRSPFELIPVGPGLFRSAEIPVACYSFTKDRDGNRYCQLGFANLKRVNPVLNWIERHVLKLVLYGHLTVFAAGFLLLLSLVLRRPMRRYDTYAVAAPALCLLCLAAWLVTPLTAGEDFLAQYGHPTFRAWAFCALSWLYVLGTFNCMRLLANSPDRQPGLYETLCSLGTFSHLYTVAYLAYWGLIGLKTWAY